MKKLIALPLIVLCVSALSQTGYSSLDSVVNVAETATNDSVKVVNWNLVGIQLNFRGEYPAGTNYTNKALDLAVKNDFQWGIARSYYVLGIIESNKGNYQTGIDYQLKSLAINETLKDTASQGWNILIIGTTYYYREDYSTAIEYFERGLKLFKQIGDQAGIANFLTNLGGAYQQLGEYDKAIDYILEAYDIFRDRSLKGEQVCSGMLGKIYKMKSSELFIVGDSVAGNKMIQTSLKYYNGALQLAIAEDDRAGIAGQLTSIGNILIDLNELDSARICLEEALLLLADVGYKMGLKDVYKGLADLEGRSGNYNKAYEYLALHMTYKDSIFNEDMDKKIASLQYEFETEKQNKEIELLKKDQEQQQFAIYMVSAISIVSLFLLLLAYRSYKRKKRDNDIIELQKHLVEEKNTEILDSITYAKRIQEAILPPTRLVKEWLPNSFVLYKPKDIVAGDFYWMEAVDGHSIGQQNADNTIIFAAADCTGHGVPGAMVSVVCHNAMNRAVREFGLTQPGAILDKTRELVIEQFEKSDEEVKDGMDIALCSLTGTALHYAGAHNPLWIVRDCQAEPVEALNNPNVSVFRQAQDDTQCIIEIKATKQPIGKIDNPQPFTNHTIELQPNDAFYIFSDGFVDQFGGQKGKKFKAKAFRELLLSIQDRNMEEQRMLINEEFEQWRGDFEQVDDVCVIGVGV